MAKKQEVDINIHITVDKEGNFLRAGNTKQVAESPKLKISLTVAQLSYLFRILYDLKVIQTRNISEIIRFVTSNVSTPKAPEISFDSFKVKFYNPDPSTIRSVNDLIIRQLNYIRKDSSSR